MYFSGKDVTVIIPTIGRATLVSSIHSVLNQDMSVGKILVVVDSDQTTIPDFHGFNTVEIIRNLGYPGGNGARTFGLDNCQTKLVMFLDDDDLWERNKVSAQLHEINSRLSQRDLQDNMWVSFSNMRLMSKDGLPSKKLVPKRELKHFPNIDDFLFLRSSIFQGTGVIAFSTICAPLALFKIEPLNEKLKFHQDISWIIKLNRKHRVKFLQVTKPLVMFRQGPNRVSMSNSFEDITQWAAEYLGNSSRLAGDYILSFGLQSARSRSNSSTKQMVRVFAWGKKYCTPSFRSYIYAAIWIGLSILRLDKIVISVRND